MGTKSNKAGLWRRKSEGQLLWGATLRGGMRETSQGSGLYYILIQAEVAQVYLF